MAGCRIVNAAAVQAVEDLNQCAASYKTAGENLITALNNAIAEMEGAAKDAFKTLIDNDIRTFVQEDLPSAVEGMSSLLEANRANFEAVDQQIADSITG